MSVSVSWNKVGVLALVAGVFLALVSSVVRGEELETPSALLPQLQEAEAQAGENSLEALLLLEKLGRSYESAGQSAASLPYWQRALKVRGALDGPRHPDTLQASGAIGDLYRRLGMHENAERFLEFAYRHEMGQRSADHPVVANLAIALSETYRAMGQDGQAERFGLEALRLARIHFGEDHPQVAAHLNNLATLYDKLGQHTRAEEAYKQAMQIDERTIGMEHPDFGIVLNNLAACYYDQARLGDAREYFQRSLTIAVTRLGHASSLTLAVVRNLAQNYETSGDSDQAQRLRDRADALDSAS